MTESPDNEKPPRFPRWLRNWLFGGLSVFGLWAIFAATAWHSLGWQHQWIGAWGDSFAPLTGIASTLAVVFAVWSVHMQRKELELQREELRLTREEMIEQRKELAAQRAAQEESARHQAAANRIADLANVIAIERARLDTVDFAVRSGAGRLSDTGLAEALEHGKRNGYSLARAHDVLRALEEAKTKLEDAERS